MKATKFATQVDGRVLKELRNFAEQSDKSISKIVTEALEEYLNKIRVRPIFLSAMDEVIEEHADLLTRLAK
jgi:uncharacterized membrane protein YheB (UPF0754 family)